MATQLQTFLEQCQNRINQYLETTLAPPEGPAEKLHQAIRYAVLNGGKRIRPVFCYAAAEAVSVSCNASDKVAASIEMIHAYSLVHDDLPPMDNDDLRRGKPTCHIAFDEATAILAGDALQTLAFEELTRISNKEAKTVVNLIHTLAKASGPQGMVAGQAIDIASVNKALPLDALEQMHKCKTGALIKASVLMGAIATEHQSPSQMEALAHYGDLLGLAFQVQDDVLDVLSNTETLGKQQGADSLLNKPTYTSLLGLEKAQQTAVDLVSEAIDTLTCFDNKAQHLRQLANYVISRTH